MIKLIASDVDGTLLRGDERTLDPRLFQLIRQFRSRGILFVAASGRQYANLRRLFAPVADEISYICENGALVIHENRILYRDEVERGKGQMLLRKIMEIPQCEALLSGVTTCYVQPKQQSYVDHMVQHVGNTTAVEEDLCAVSEPFLKISLYDPNGVDEATHRRFNELVQPEMTAALGGRCWLDFFHTHVHKGTALAQLQQVLDICPEECMVFGDNENDIGLMRQASHSYVMTGGHPRTMQEARYCTEDVTETLLDVFRNLA